MGNVKQSPASILNRIERLERQNLRLKQAFGVMFLTLATLFLMGQASPKAHSVEAESFVLKDANGLVRARWETRGNGVLLRLFDTKERIRTELAAADTGAFVTLGDATGRPRVMLGVQGGERPEEATLGLTDNNGKSMVLLTVAGNASGLKIFDGENRLAAGVMVTPVGSTIAFSDPAGNPRAKLELSTGGPALLLYGEDGKVVWLSALTIESKVRFSLAQKEV